MKIIAVDYKGKHFVLMDENRLDVFDDVNEYINVEKLLNNDFMLIRHVEDCLYYGIPAYIGNNKELNEKIKKYEQTFK